MNETILMAIVGIISSLLTWGATHTRRRSRAEARTIEIENTERILKIYREMIEDLSERIKNYELRIKNYE